MRRRIEQLGIDLATLLALTVLAFIGDRATDIDLLVGNPMLSAILAAFVLNARRELRDYRERRKFRELEPFE
jgi:hypothetical protein